MYEDYDHSYLNSVRFIIFCVIMRLKETKDEILILGSMNAISKQASFDYAISPLDQNRTALLIRYQRKLLKN